MGGGGVSALYSCFPWKLVLRVGSKLDNPGNSSSFVVRRIDDKRATRRVCTEFWILGKVLKLASNFPDLEKVWKMEIKSGKMEKALIFFFKSTTSVNFFLVKSSSIAPIHGGSVNHNSKNHRLRKAAWKLWSSPFLMLHRTGRTQSVQWFFVHGRVRP